MNTLIIITISSIGGGAIVWLAMKGANRLLVAALHDCQQDRDAWIRDACKALGQTHKLQVENTGLREAHSRCADALQTVRGKLEAIEQLANSPDTIRKKDIRAVLGGDA